MVPKHVYEILDPEEQKLWHSHEYEVSSGMLVCPKPSAFGHDEWAEAETAAMREVAGLYGKTWHFSRLIAVTSFLWVRKLLVACTSRY